MISISSAFPVLPAQDSLYYELLALTAICGEVPCACADRLTSSKSYRKKVVTNLTHDKILRIFSKDHLRGYRLGIRGKRLLRERAPERFQFYLSGRTDTNSIKSSPARRLRLHRIAQAYVTMLNAGAAIYRDEKPPVFVPGGSSPCRIESTAFYDSREMKELGLEMIKVHGSRMVGSLMTPSHTFAVFNGMDAVPTFDTQIEQRGKIMLQNIRYTQTGASHTPDGILLSDQWTVMTTLLEDAKTYKKEHFLFGEGYEHFYFLTNDYHGETLLWLLCHPDVIGQLNATLLQELQPPCRNAFIENVYSLRYDHEDLFSLFSIDLDTGVEKCIASNIVIYNTDSTNLSGFFDNHAIIETSDTRDTSNISHIQYNIDLSTGDCVTNTLQYTVDGDEKNVYILAETSDAFLVRNGVEEKEITVVDNTGVPSSLMASIPQYALIQKSDYWNGVSAYTPINDAL